MEKFFISRSFIYQPKDGSIVFPFEAGFKDACAFPGRVVRIIVDGMLSFAASPNVRILTKAGLKLMGDLVLGDEVVFDIPPTSRAPELIGPDDFLWDLGEKFAQFRTSSPTYILGATSASLNTFLNAFVNEAKKELVDWYIFRTLRDAFFFHLLVTKAKNIVAPIDEIGEKVAIPGNGYSSEPIFMPICHIECLSIASAPFMILEYNGSFTNSYSINGFRVDVG